MNRRPPLDRKWRSNINLTAVDHFQLRAGHPHHPRGYVQQWNLSLEQQLPARISLTAAYVGSKGTHLAQYSQQINQISDIFLSQAATQFASGGRSAVSLLRSVPNPYYVNGQALALATPTTTAGQLLRPFPQYTSVELAGQGEDVPSIVES